MIERIPEKIALPNRLVVVIMALAVMGLGVWSFLRLPIDAFPDVSPVLVQVFTVTEGLAPEEVEKYVTYPIERKMTGLPSVSRIRSVSNFGLSVVSVYFQDGTDIYLARQVVAEKLQEAREQIPDGFGHPQLGPIATGQGQILYYYLRDRKDRYSLTELRTLQDWVIKPNLEQVEGVTEVLGIGGHEKQFQVELRPEALLRHGLTAEEIVERIRANNGTAGAQYIERNGEQLVVRSVGLVTGVSDLKRVVVKTEQGKPVFLRQVADVKVGGAIRRGLQTRNGEEEVVAGMVIKLMGTNSSTVISRVEERLAELRSTLPDGVELVPFYEQKTIVQGSVDTVTDALLQGIGLVTLVLFVFFWRVRPILVAALSIPFSVLFAFVAMKIAGISANLMSLGGLAIAIGMMVDGTIVIVENVQRRLAATPEGGERGAEGGDGRESLATIVGQACREVVRPITFAIAIVIIVFVPLYSLGGVEGKTFRPLAYTVGLGMTGSLVYALLVAPVLSMLLMRRSRPQTGSKGGGLTVWLGSVADKLSRGYGRVVSGASRRWVVVTFCGAALLALGATAFVRLGSEFTPRLMEGDIMVNLTFAPSSSLTESKRMVMLIEKRLLEIDEVEEIVSRVGRGEVGAHSAPVNVAHTNVVLKPKSKWSRARSQLDIEAEIRERLATVPGAQISITQPIQLSVDELIGGVKAELAIKLFGPETEVLVEKASAIAEAIRGLEGAADVQVSQMAGAPQLRIRPRREELARYGLNVSDVQGLVKTAVGGVSAGQVFRSVRRFDIYVRYRPEERATPAQIRNIVIRTPAGQKLRLSEVADVERVLGPRQVMREDARRFIGIQCNVVGRDIGSFVSEAKRRIQKNVSLPPGYLVEWGGQFALQQKANRRLSVVIPIALALITLLLYVALRSWKSSLLILSNIPLALVGGVVALWVSGQSLSVPASVGFISLFGIALENGMVLVTYLDRLSSEGKPCLDTVVRGSCMRLRPVVMTAATTALGLIPLLVATGTGSEVQRPLATVVVGGLVTSTMATLLFLPALYLKLRADKGSRS
jgi:cobalt-zinc-cadmium resistance protein CzcA